MSKKEISESLIVETVIRHVTNDANRKRSYNENECHFYQLRAALRCGYAEPFSAEQTAMNTMLTKLRADKKSTESAWELYHEIKTHGFPDTQTPSNLKDNFG